MNKGSEAILAIKPVTFKYNIEKTVRTKYALAAGEVAKLSPDLVV